MTHICFNKLNINGLDNGLSYDGREAIVWTNAGTGILLINCENKLQWNHDRNFYIFIKEKCIWAYRQEIDAQFVSASMFNLVNSDCIY